MSGPTCGCVTIVIVMWRSFRSGSIAGGSNDHHRCRVLRLPQLLLFWFMLGLTLSSYYFLVLGENGEAGVRVVKDDIEAAATTERYEQSTRRKKTP